MGLPLSVSPNTIDLEGFSETETIQVRESINSVPRTSTESLVSKPSALQQGITSDTTIPSTSSQRSTSSTRTTNEISRLQFIREYYYQHHPRRASEVMSQPIRQSSCREYENKWKQFLKYLNEEGIELRQCSLNNVLNFFTMLFDKRETSSLIHCTLQICIVCTPKNSPED